MLPGDPQSLRVDGQVAGEVRRIDRVRELIARIEPGHRREEEADILDRARQWSLDARGAARAATIGALRHQARRLTRNPTTLLKLPGLRSEPPMSLPSAIGSIPVASAAAAPPRAAAGRASRFHGLRVGPKTLL